MVKKTTWLLGMVLGIVVGANSAQAAEIQASPVELGSPAPAAGDKMTSNIGHHAPEQEKSYGLGVDVFVTKNLALSSSFTMLAMEPPLAAGQNGDVGGLGFSPSRMGGSIGLKVLFN